MVKRGFVLAVFDALALIFLYFVLQDVSSRVSYVKSEFLSGGFSYSPFIRVFSITGTKVQFPLVSPATLDWVQVSIATLALVNGYYILTILRRSRAVPK